MEDHLCTYLPGEVTVTYHSTPMPSGMALVKDMTCRGCGTITRTTTLPDGTGYIERITPKPEVG